MCSSDGLERLSLFFFLPARTYDNLDACEVVRSAELSIAAKLLEVTFKLIGLEIKNKAVLSSDTVSNTYLIINWLT